WNRRYSTARPSRNQIARSVWSAAYPAALVVADESLMRTPCKLGNEGGGIRRTPNASRPRSSRAVSLDWKSALRGLWESKGAARFKLSGCDVQRASSPQPSPPQEERELARAFRWCSIEMYARLAAFDRSA